MERITFKDAPAGLYQALLHVQHFVDKSGLDIKLLELVRFRVSQINDCAYCLDMHFKEALHHGENAQRLYSVSAWRETTYYSEPEKAALAFAEKLTRMPAGEDNEHIHDELNKYFSKEEIAHLTLAIIQINSWNRLTRSFGAVAGNYQVAAASTLN